MIRQPRGTTLALAAVVSFAVLAGIAPEAVAEGPSATPTPTGSTSPSSSPVSPASPATATAAAADSHLGSVSRDSRSSISVNLALGKVSVRFRSQARRGRLISLQQQVDGAWVEISRKKMNSKGRASFAVGRYRVESVYRAVELRYRGAPLRRTKTAGWESKFYDPFNGTMLDDSKWSQRPSANQGPRYCSRTTEEMTVVKDGTFRGMVDYLKDAELAQQYHEVALGVQKQGCWWGWEKSPTGLGVFDSAMITTQGKFAVNTAEPGMVAARVKFPVPQGMHGAIWLQNDTKAEIDLIEGFGYGRGISNYIHTHSRKTLDSTGSAWYKLGAYVEPDKTRNKKWWSKYHDYSVSWDAKGFIFRVDGKISQRIKIKPGNVDYSVILSTLVSDWEAYRISAPVITKGFEDVELANLPEEMSVSWVKVWSKA